MTMHISLHSVTRQPYSPQRTRKPICPPGKRAVKADESFRYRRGAYMEFSEKSAGADKCTKGLDHRHR
jgi:hypothetical protein